MVAVNAADLPDEWIDSAFSVIRKVASEQSSSMKQVAEMLKVTRKAAVLRMAFFTLAPPTLHGALHVELRQACDMGLIG